MKEAGNKSVELVEIANRNHATIWSRVSEEGDETAARIIEFVSR